MNEPADDATNVGADLASRIPEGPGLATPVSAQKKPNAFQGFLIIMGACFLATGAVSNLDSLGKVWYDEGSLLPATTCYEVFTSIESMLGVKNARLASAWSQLATCYSKVPRYHDAIRAEYQGIALRTRLYGESNPNVLIMKAHVGDFLVRDKRYAEGDKLLAELLKQCESNRPPEPISKAYILEAMAHSYMAQNRWEQAEAAAQMLLPIDDELMADSRVGFDGRELLAEIYAKSGKPADAERIANDSLKIKSDRLKDSFVSLALAHETLGKVLICSKQTEAASTHFKSAMYFLEKEYGTNSEKVQYWRARYEHLLTETDPFAKTN